VRAGLRRLAETVRRVSEIPEVRRAVSERMEEFERIGKSGVDSWMLEAVFCILAANFSAVKAYEMALEIQRRGLLWSGGQAELERLLRWRGHRFPRARASFIVSARGPIREARAIVPRMGSREAREWLRRRVRGFGMKEASHFLRNTGRKDLAIIDRHILRALAEHGAIEEVPKSLTRRRYLEIESLLSQVAEEVGASLAELDLYIWYTRTGFVFR